MRIIGGTHGGRILKPPKTFRARPTTDIAREGLFNILNNHFDFEGLSVLDFFAGTGSIGMEFASRGASAVTMVEMNFHHYSFINRTLQELHMDHGKVIRADFFKIVHKLKGEYDIVFADPPYDLKEFIRVPELILGAKIIKPGGWFILEHSGAHDFSSMGRFFDLRKYGSVHFSFFRCEDKV